jgi:uncharacterized protein (TIGR02145 family)
MLYMKQIFIFIFIFSVFHIFAQDVTITVSGLYNEAALELDTIVLDDLTNGTQAVLYNLPAWVTNYEINLSKGGHVNALPEHLPFFEHFVVKCNLPGKVEAKLFSITRQRVKYEIFDIKGRRLKSISDELQQGGHVIEIDNGFSGLSVIKVSFNNQTFCVKNIGSGLTPDIQVAISSEHSTPGHTNVQGAFKTAITGDFTYKPGDTISLTLKKYNYNENSLICAPVNGDHFNVWMSIPCPGTPTVTDYDGNVYKTVQIGNQCWMKENMKAIHDADGTPLLNGTGVPAGIGLPKRYWFNYADNPEISEIFGKLYTCSGATNNSAFVQHGWNKFQQGICPTGWHVATRDEWKELESQAAPESSYKLRSSQGWNNNNNGSDQLGFTILPAGTKTYNPLYGSYFTSIHSYTCFWAASMFIDGEYVEVFPAASGSIKYGATHPNLALSVRCLKDY